MMEITPKYHYKKNFLDDYLLMVDRKLYMAKAGGRNRIETC
jgi:PleD family two-component response regulator